jgi:hypothetical protein
MKSTPAVYKARLMARSLAAVSDVPFSATSARLAAFYMHVTVQISSPLPLAASIDLGSFCQNE